MENYLSKDNIVKINILGLYQIIGGVIGMGLTLWLILGLVTIPGRLIMLICIAIALYSYSIYCGTLLLKKNITGLKHSLINQYLQIVNFTILGFTFQYVSGAYLTVGFEIADSFNILFASGISTWKITISGETQTLQSNFNLVALFFIIYIARLNKSINKNSYKREISSIGQ